VRFATAALLLGMAASALTACGARQEAAPAAPGSETLASRGATRGEGAMPLVRATKLGDVLGAAGLDPKNLPPLETLDKSQRLRVMKTFNEALGVSCFDCHAEDFAADTRRKRVAKRMWNELVRVVAIDDGGTVYCDSCHQGAMFTLDRRDKLKVVDYMSDVLVGKMKRTDGRDHDCATCHGDPPDFKMLVAWKHLPAPDIDLTATASPESAAAAPASLRPAAGNTPPPSSTAPASAAAVSAAAEPAPSPKAAAQPAPADCGDKNCPLQVWMRQNVATAIAANDSGALASALDRLAGMAPEPSWSSWVEISKVAAEAARRGDMAEARKSCQGCHTAYKTKWRERYRTRAVR
jgi:hypothetical protein